MANFLKNWRISLQIFLNGMTRLIWDQVHELVFRGFPIRWRILAGVSGNSLLVCTSSRSEYRSLSRFIVSGQRRVTSDGLSRRLSRLRLLYQLPCNRLLHHERKENPGEPACQSCRVMPSHSRYNPCYHILIPGNSVFASLEKGLLLKFLLTLE